MEIEFDFRAEGSGLFGAIRRPVARVVLERGQVKLPEIFYVDSGADVTLIPLSVGELLGFTILRTHEITEIKGIGEKGVPILIRRLKMWLGDYGFTARVAWCLTEGVPPLLGREDVFKLFSVTFERNRATVIRTA